MEFVNTNIKELKELSEKLHNIKKHGTNKIILCNTMEYLMPQSEQKNIGFEITNGFEPVYFNIAEETVKILPERLNKIINASILHLKKKFPELDEKEMYNYYILFALIHETRHVNQYLITENAVQFPYEIVKQAYNDMSNIGYLDVNFLRNYISLYLYNKDNKRFIIERTANIESTEIVRNLAQYEENDLIADLFESMRQRNITYGYDEQYNGSLEETYKKLYLTPLYNELPKGEAIPIRDRILYGLPINEETKKKVLQYKY